MTETTGRTRRQAQNQWNYWGGGPTPITRIPDLESGAVYEIEVRKTFHGRTPSPWSTSVEMTTD